MDDFKLFSINNCNKIMILKSNKKQNTNKYQNNKIFSRHTTELQIAKTRDSHSFRKLYIKKCFPQALRSHKKNLRI